MRRGTRGGWLAGARVAFLCFLLAAPIALAPALTADSAPTRGGAPVDPSTLDRKVLFGYQGWFFCPGDGSYAGWVHWFRGRSPTADTLTVDLWPDMTELPPEERCATRMSLPDGSPATVFSSYRAETVMRHFRWMEEYGIDGVFLQRFVSVFADSTLHENQDQVARNVRAGAEAHGRVFAMMYDISGAPTSSLVDDILNDWRHLVDDLRITESPRYLRHNGRPVLGLWGFGFNHNPDVPQAAVDLIANLTTTGAPQSLVTLMGGVPTYWRTLSGDSWPEPVWGAVYRSFDVLSPWTVGRYGDNASADIHRDTVLVPDLAEAGGSGVEYMPVVFPGFSWYNLAGGPVNEIPRNGGHFFWRQVYDAIASGATMLYVAMFDEVDEGTAMFKLASTSADLPVEATLVPLDIDGYALPSDWYLRLGGEASRMMRGEIPLSVLLPPSPGPGGPDGGAGPPVIPLAVASAAIAAGVAAWGLLRFRRLRRERDNRKR